MNIFKGKRTSAVCWDIMVVSWFKLDDDDEARLWFDTPIGLWHDKLCPKAEHIKFRLSFSTRFFLVCILWSVSKMHHLNFTGNVFINLPNQSVWNILIEQGNQCACVEFHLLLIWWNSYGISVKLHSEISPRSLVAALADILDVRGLFVPPPPGGFRQPVAADKERG